MLPECHRAALRVVPDDGGLAPRAALLLVSMVFFLKLRPGISEHPSRGHEQSQGAKAGREPRAPIQRPRSDSSSNESPSCPERGTPRPRTRGVGLLKKKLANLLSVWPGSYELQARPFNFLHLGVIWGQGHQQSWRRIRH